MTKPRRKQFVTLLLVLVALVAVGLTMYTEQKGQAQYYCNDPCNPNCWGT